MNNIDKYNKIFLSLFSCDDVTDLKFGSNGWDSAGHLILITELENVFSIKLDVEDILGFKSYVHGKDIMKKYGIDL